jgi:glycosyltransferase involved in cell wall biosynthesis
MANYKRLGLSQRIKDWENVLVKKANVVFASAPGLVNRLKDLNERTYFAPNAGSYELFSIASRKSTACPVSLRGIKPPIIGFAGTIDDYKVDAGLVLKAAKACPDYSFVIVGPRAETDKAPDLEELSALPNVRLLPEVKYEDQVPYYAYFDAFIIPYRLNEYTVGGCFPVKFFDSLAAGLPTIVTNLPAYELYQSVCYIAKSGEEFVTMIKQAVSENSGSKETLRKNIAKENSWDNKVEKMLRVIKEL